MKHVYPPRHPAWLDDEPRQSTPADPGAPQAVAPREQGDAAQGDAAGAAQQAGRGDRKDAVDGTTGASRRP